MQCWRRRQNRHQRSSSSCPQRLGPGRRLHPQLEQVRDKQHPWINVTMYYVVVTSKVKQGPLFIQG